MREMKDSGIEWIGNIPKNWSICPIGCEFQEVLDKNLFLREKKSLKFTFGNIVDKKDFNENIDDYVEKTIRNYTVVKPGDIVLNGLNLNFDFVTLRIGQVKSKGLITSAYTSFRIIDSTKLSSDFVTYLFKSYDSCKAFHNMGGGVRKILNFSELKKNYFIFPSLQEQRKIADFLDEKCSEIDALTADIQTQIETLEEYKKSVITEAVTKGLDPNVELKDSGVEWIGKIPADWDVFKGKYVLKYLQKPVKQEDDVITCFRDGEVTLRKNRREDGFTMSDKEIGYQGVDVGDLVVHGMDGFAGAIGISDSRGKASPVLNVLDSSMVKKFIMYYLRSMAYGNVFTAIATGIRVRSCDLRWNKLANLPYPVPPFEEQRQIADFLDQKCSEIDQTIYEKQQQLETLAEYKKSLIYEYVTGKKEVA